MKYEHSKRIRLIYSIAFSALTVIAGLCLIVACWGVYRSGGEQIYTPQKVADAFSTVAIPVYLWLALAIGGFLLDAVLPAEKNKKKPEKNPLLILQRLQQTRTVDDATQQQLYALQRKGTVHIIISIVLLALFTAACCGYAVDTTHFDHVKTMDAAVRPVWLTILFMALPMGYSIFAAYHYRTCVNRQIDVWKQVGTPGAPAQQTTQPGNRIRIVRWAIFGAAVVLIAVGFATGGWQDVLTKAVNICTECVGLG